MNLNATLFPAGPIHYPDSDGKPMADNTKQARWIVVLFSNLAALFYARADVFVACDLLWYPVEGQAEIRIAPDVLVVFGRPKGDRGSYKQWEEGGVPLTVAFEILSPGNTVEEMDDKRAFYEEHGVEEYYVYNPDTNRLLVFVRRGDVLRRVRPVDGFVSPLLGIRFDLSGPELVVLGPEEERFLTFEELKEERQREGQQRRQAEARAEQEKQRAEGAEHRAEHETQRANKERQRAEQEKQRAEQEKQRAERAEQQLRLAAQRAARLTDLGLKAVRGQATPEELQEYYRLLEQPDAPP
jgi:Uma2 family endonuclease